MDLENKSYDNIIIGGGHNGLVAAAYLAKQGKSVCVLERRDILGGCASTEELWPGFKISPAAYVISLFSKQIIEDLRLKHYGLDILPRNPSSLSLFENGNLILGSDHEQNRKSIEKFSLSDSIKFKKYEEKLTQIAEAIEPILSIPPVNIATNGRKNTFKDMLRNVKSGYALFKAVKKLNTNLPLAIRLMTSDAKNLLNDWFESDELKSTLATDAIIGAFISPSCPGSAYVLLHHVMGDAGGSRGVWGYVRGGMGGLADSLEKACLELGVDIFKNKDVKNIVVENGIAVAVQLNSSETIKAKNVLSSVDANLTFNKFIDPKELPDEFLDSIKKIDYASASAKINLALSDLPDFGVSKELLSGTIHISPGMKYIDEAFIDAKRGHFSKHPILEITIPSTVDDTLAPPGCHVMSIFVQYAPYNLNGGWTNAAKNKFTEACLKQISNYCDIKKLILHKQTLTPVDLESTYGLTGGNIMQGGMSLNQLGPFRPVVGWADYKTPIKNLYLCGAATHPGGGVMGLCGKNSAEVVLNN